MIGIFGGTFDPVHFGHLRPALEVQQMLGLQQVRFIPSGHPPHREMPRASASQRLAMLRAAIDEQPGFVLDEREIRRQGPSYMVDTLLSLREELGETPLCLILGYDAFLNLPDWYRWEQLIELSHIVVTHRPGWLLTEYRANPELVDLLEQHQQSLSQLGRQRAGGVVFVPVTQLEISATSIRRQIRDGESIRYLLPDSVIEIIEKQHIYR